MKLYLLVFALVINSALLAKASKRLSHQTGCEPKEPTSPLNATIQTSLQKFIDAQRKGQWDEAAKYLADFEFDSKRHKHYRNKREQAEELEGLRSRRILDFTVWHGMTSTAEQAYPMERRVLTFIGCAKYEEDGEILSLWSILTVYRDKGRWRFSPISLPPKRVKSPLPENKLPDAPPPKKPALL